jgi:glucuronate isomerase
MCDITGATDANPWRTYVNQVLQTASYSSNITSAGPVDVWNTHQTASEESLISRGAQAFQAATYRATSKSSAYQTAQIASAKVTLDGYTHDSAQVASHGTGLISSQSTAQVAVYGGDTGYGVISGANTLQASSALSFMDTTKQVTQLSSYQSSAARSNTSAQIATMSSSMTGIAYTGYTYQETGWTYQSVQMSSVGSLMGGTVASTQMAATNSSMVATTNSAQIAVQDSSITGATASVVMASTNSKVLAVKNAAVIGGIGGLAKNQGELVQGAGGTG